MLGEIAELKTRMKTDDKENSYQKLSGLFVESVNKIISGKDCYNSEHPFFGILIFHKKLIIAYTKIEDYEKCEELQKMNLHL